MKMAAQGEINQNTAKQVLGEMFATGKEASDIVSARDLRQISDAASIAGLVEQVLANYPDQVADYIGGKQAISRWLFGQVMRAAQGQANPQLVQAELQRQLDLRRQAGMD
jgi:aspartyl-tRNA(Asn)/glutamyl-tRNA(Gln) amidotransferase subunit B